MPTLRCRLAAVERIAGTHEIEVEFLAEHHAVGGGKTGARLWQLHAAAIEDVELTQDDIQEATRRIAEERADEIQSP